MYFIIIAGASGSGKTTIVKLFEQIFTNKGLSTLVISMDQYYCSMTPGEAVNWDDISAIDTTLLAQDLEQIRNGKSVQLPTYDYVTHQRMLSVRDSGIPDVLILEGIFALYDGSIRTLADLKIFVDADPIKTCLKRRLERDIRERGRSAESVINQYFNQVLPGYEKFVISSKQHADLCYVNEKEVPTSNSLFLKVVEIFVLDNLKKY